MPRVVAKLQQLCSTRQQRADVSGRARAQRGEIVAALERRDHAPFGMLPSNLEQPLGYPGVIRLVQHELRERVVAMRVETCRDQHHLGPKRVERGENRAAETELELA